MFHCAIYSYTITLGRVLSFFACTRDCNFIIWVSFCCLSKWYWSNSKMTSILYNLNTELNARQVAWYHVAINSTQWKPWVYWLRFKLSIVYHIWWPDWYCAILVMQGSWVRVPLWARIFHFVILSFRSLQLELSHTNHCIVE